MPQQITLNVNGEGHVVEVEPDSMLLYALRDSLGLHGPKFGCGLAECGACAGRIKIGRVVVAHDCGLVVNPDGLNNRRQRDPVA